MKLNRLLPAGRSAWGGIALYISCIGIFSGCSGDGTIAGVGSGGTGSLLASISGKVADGYLVNATVFLDKNGNYRLDAGEPATVTDSNGAYKLSVDVADVGKYPIVAQAIKDVTIDKDTDRTVAGSFVLSIPKESVSGTVSNNFISPITSQIRELLETGLYTTMQQAADSLRSRMELPAGTDLMSDFVAENNPAMHTVARNIATIMGNQMDNVIGASGAATTVDVNRYRGMMGTIFSNMASVNSQGGVSTINGVLTTVLPQISPTLTGQPYKNMSTAFKGSMGGDKH